MMIKIYTAGLTASDHLQRHNEAMNLLAFAIEQTGNKADRLRLGFNEYKKPYLLDYPDIHFNFSYAGDRTFCAVAECSVGLDAETIMEAPYDIMPFYFSEDEREYVNECNSKHRFFEVWTKKESYMKYRGMGFYMLPLSFSVRSMSNAFLYHTIWDNTALSVAAENPIKDVSIISKGN